MNLFSYIFEHLLSKQMGIPWTKFAALDEQFQKLQNENQNLQNENQNLQKNLEDQNQKLQKEIHDLEDVVSMGKTAIRALRDTNNSLYMKNNDMYHPHNMQLERLEKRLYAKTNRFEHLLQNHRELLQRNKQICEEKSELYTKIEELTTTVTFLKEFSNRLTQENTEAKKVAAQQPAFLSLIQQLNKFMMRMSRWRKSLLCAKQNFKLCNHKLQILLIDTYVLCKHRTSFLKARSGGKY